ncbi:hypothetical protein Ani05nite_04310 [Amorphoplanes nipponensis]|uniref:Peptidase inhibitor family I36 n=2 Tax=Actinoplanes nipponensis TaxID=135950 RepID=A0A919MJQ6_9ACTN|nr:hypothetical protein Ani05nite_04310 [Actinoplanes nipponensis]
MKRSATKVSTGVAMLAVAAGVLSVGAPASADSGGGCRRASQNTAVSVCISVRSGTWNPLWADFYVDGTSQGESRTKTYINVSCSNGAFYGHFAGNWDISGTHSPQWSYSKPCSSGYGYTHTVFYNSSGNFIYSADSPNQYW